MLKKLDNFIESLKSSEKEKIIFLLSFLLPLVMMLTIIIAKGVYPFGDKCILRTDFYHQYLPFYSELKHKLSNFDSLLYTYDVGLGTNFITLFAYYLSCPFNILLFLVPQKFILEFMTLMIALKISLSGLTFSYYLVKRYKSDSFAIIIFALFYAMSGYVGAYYWNIMWLDNIVLFPLLMLGFENVCNGKKPYLYIVTLAVSILCNYYIGAITCIFLVIYFVFYNILKNNAPTKILKNLVYVAFYSVVGVMLSAILLLPVVCAFSTTASSGGSFPTQVKEYFTFAEALGRHLPLAKSENGIDYWPNIYSGVLCLPFLILYFTSKKFQIKEKICYGVILLFFLASFAINVLDYTWHILKYPNSLPCRQSFIYTFLLLCICFKPFLKLRSLKDKNVIISFVSVIVGLIICEKLITSDKVSFNSIYASIILLFIYFILVFKLTSKKGSKNFILCALLVVACVEAFVNMYETSIYTIKRNDYMENVEDIRKVVSDLKMKTNDFYRLERVNMKAKDDGAFINFPSSSIFSSSSYKAGSDYYKEVGMEASTNAYSITGSTPFMDSFFSVKYKIAENEIKELRDLNIREIDNNNKVYLYQNLDTMPLSFMLTDHFLNTYDRSSGNPATIQNNISRTLKLGVMLKKIDVDISGIKAFLKVEEAGDYYAFVRDKSIKEVTVSFDTTSKQYKNLNRGFFIELGYLKEGSDIEFRNDTSEDDLLIEVFKFDYEVFKNVINELKSYSSFYLRRINSTNILYDIEAKKKGTCLISLPYDEGFKVKVDGKDVETKKVFDFLLGFDLDIGRHEIEMSFVPKGFREGALISFIGLLLLVAVIYRCERYEANKKRP